MSLPLARTPREAHLYIGLHPCECGEAEFPIARSSLIQVDDGSLARQYDGTCPGCGNPRRFVFALPTWPNTDPSAFGGEEPSQIIDAGEWLLVGHRLASSVPAERPRSAKKREEHSEVVEMAVACVDEVLKFIPSGGHHVPSEAFWTDRGRAYRDAQPQGTFDRARLEAYRGGVASCL